MYTESMKSHKHLHPIKRWKSLGMDYKVLSIALVLVVVASGLVGFAQIQDRRNEQFLRQIVAVFDTLEADLEQATGVEVEDKSGCFTTSEKFGEGKTGCFARLESTDIVFLDEAYVKLLDAMNRSNNFTDIRSFEFQDSGFYFYYKGGECVSGLNPVSTDEFFVECPVSVRAGNSDLTKALF